MSTCHAGGYEQANRIGRGGATAAILSSLTSTCRRHGIDPQRYLTQLLANLRDTPISRLDAWLPDQWQKRQPAPSVDRSLAEI